MRDILATGMCEVCRDLHATGLGMFGLNVCDGCRASQKSHFLEEDGEDSDMDDFEDEEDDWDKPNDGRSL